MRAVHSRLMVVKEKQGGACYREKRGNPSGPACPQNAVRTLQFQHSHRQKQNRKKFVLQNLEMMGEAVIPALRAKRPELGVAPNQNKNTRDDKAERPCVANRGPAVANIGFRQNEKSR